MNTDFSQYDIFFELTPDLVCIAGFDGYFKKINPAVKEVLGYSYEELYSNPIHHFIYQEDKENTAKERSELLKSTPLVNFENRYVTKSGEIVWLSWTSQPVTKDQIIFAIARNITQKKELEADRNSLLTNLTEINKDLRHIGHMTSHDLRSPVNNLLSIYELIDYSKITDKETLELMEIFKMSCEDLRDKLNVYSKELREKQSLYIPFKEIDLQKLVKKVSKSIYSLLKNSKATVVTDFDELPKITSNSTYLESIFLNLTTNSIKYKKAGADPVITISCKRVEGKIHLTFSDNGLGFDLEKVKDKLFGFQQTFHRNEDSRGIGLYLVYNHVQSLGGTIEVESKVGEGTTFRIILNSQELQ
ncbi:PAS domain-containing sensor histidine kinase [Algoriphagus aquimarinus]|uniref:histidine kinase n=1 Tax=Algoriphagus aquimarinus TaxID=237018 RepID=A0A1I0VJ94_9BACT|nr:PAS domain-containing sensor histidine kinase [Algoriphagus aquimarinus]SFA76268.1 PAS domain S-box-containing protein [Algoriphagus aquimarinus]|tara:strand:- start:348305 stop:349384 length:1080 start_codon:yes stop_codon:yes gene_type:complete